MSKKDEQTLNPRLKLSGAGPVLPEARAEAERQPEAARIPWYERARQVTEQLHGVPKSIDRFIERQVQNDRLSPKTPLWWMLVRPEVMRERQAQLDEAGKEELNNLRLSHVNALFWMLAFLGWVWVSCHRLDMLSLGIDSNLYKSLLRHWGWIALAMAVYCFGARRGSESILEEMARVPGMIAVAIVLTFVMNGVTGAASGIIPGSSTFIAAGIAAFIAIYSLMFRISEEEPNISIPEGTGVLLGFVLGVGFNVKIYGAMTGMISGIAFIVAIGVGTGIADDIKSGRVWVGRLAYAALLVSWLIISGIMIGENGAMLLGHL